MTIYMNNETSNYLKEMKRLYQLLEKYGLKRVINASGRMTALGGAAPSASVMEAMKIGGQLHVEMDELINRSGSIIADKLGTEDAVIVNSASSGIALAVAALISEGNIRKAERLHADDHEKNEIIMFKGHNVNYGAPIETMVHLGGGTLVEVGYANEGQENHIREAISEQTAGILFVQSHHAVQKNMLTVEEAAKIAQSYQIPFIVDAAAEEDLRKYVEHADIAIFSGSKAIEGPTSGIVAGKRQFINRIKVQFQGIGRSMKIGKESIFGLLQALEEYEQQMDTHEDKKTSLNVFLDLNDLKGIDVTIVQDEAGRNIYRARVHVDPEEAGLSAEAMTRALRQGDVAIYTRDYGVKQGFFDIDPRPLQGDDRKVIIARIRELVE